ncbi:uncharacterized protein LOC107267520 isoform X2 [Cephus cinctus]|uniref:Uncharacterized protein LOC107267520 isoform X2 n=1 Tax=Cephus cinctus TaxID=211228 RepID=A0AAJ7W133_CEPCN|nr:uncharacterized protein LOC107267520 isoform X2 [Cephus cinctus]
MLKLLFAQRFLFLLLDDDVRVCCYIATRLPRNMAVRKETRVDFGRDAVIRKIDPDPAEFKIEDVNNRTFSARMLAEELEDGQASKSEDLARLTGTNVIRTRTLFVDVNPATSLIVKPGTLARIIFDVTNSHSLTVRHYFQARSSTFSVANLQPRATWINSGQTTSVAMDVIIPATTSDSTVDTVTLSVQGIETVEKSAYIYVTSSTSVAITDTTKPSISYSFNDNCSGKLDSDKCSKSRWSVEVTATDSGTGLQRVTSLPSGIYPITTFVSGTKSSVTFYYTATCCYTTVQVTASDLLGNSNAQTIDVTVWTNLTQGEIAAIVLGILILLLLIILVVLIVIYFIRKRKSLDLPYTQRYGSRTAPKPERTSF